MNDAAWERLVDALDLKFGLARHGRDRRALADRTDLDESIDFIEFTKGGQNYRVERVAGPAIVDRKTHFHKAAGSSVRFENIYDPDETTYKVVFLRKQGSDWQPIQPEELAL